MRDPKLGKIFNPDAIVATGKSLTNCKPTQPIFTGSFSKQHGWLPIVTAPKDGTPILACTIGYGAQDGTGLLYHPRCVQFRIFHPNAPGKGAWRNSHGHKENFLTHWMPVPTAP